jgi:AraC-like DNA-binding protein
MGQFGHATDSFAILLTGFSLVSALILALTHFSGDQYRDQWRSRVMGWVLLLALSCLQLAHFAWLYLDQDWIASLLYRMTLYVVAPAFFLFSEPLLQPQARAGFHVSQFSHLIPILISPFLPAGIALPLAFVIGAGYLAWLARSLIALRQDRANYQTEIVLLGAVLLIAIGASLLGLAQAAIPDKPFFSVYAIAIGVAFFLVQVTLGRRPQLTAEVREAVQASYASSTLHNVDCTTALTQLDRLMRTDRVYTDPDLSMPSLAERLGLSGHQLSELLNNRLGKGFSRYLREQRVSAAQMMLVDEPTASVLSVGLSVGFTSQSNFYEAFREVAGTTPGQYRKLQVKGAPR